MVLGGGSTVRKALPLHVGIVLALPCQTVVLPKGEKVGGCALQQKLAPTHIEAILKTSIIRNIERIRPLEFYTCGKCAGARAVPIAELNRHLRGWANDFAFGFPTSALRAMDWYLLTSAAAKPTPPYPAALSLAGRGRL
jgi:hypothetical protein